MVCLISNFRQMGKVFYTLAISMLIWRFEHFQSNDSRSLLVAACEKKSVVLFDPITNRKTNSIKNAHSDCVNCVK